MKKRSSDAGARNRCASATSRRIAMPVPRRRTETPRRSRPRGMVMPCSVNAASAASWASVRPCPLSLRAWTASAPDAIVRSQAAKKPGSMTESASSIRTASHSSSRACSRPACLAAARPGGSSWEPLEHRRAERARDLGRAIGAAIGHDEHVVARSQVPHDRLEAAADHLLLVVRGHEHEEPDLRVRRWPRFAIEPRRDREQSEMGRADQAGQAEHDRDATTKVLKSMSFRSVWLGLPINGRPQPGIARLWSCGRSRQFAGARPAPSLQRLLIHWFPGRLLSKSVIGK